MDTIVIVNGLYNPPLTKQNQGGQPELFVRLVLKFHLLQSKYTEHTLTYVFRKCVPKICIWKNPTRLGQCLVE